MQLNTLGEHGRCSILARRNDHKCKPSLVERRSPLRRAVCRKTASLVFEDLIQLSFIIAKDRHDLLEVRWIASPARVSDVVCSFGSTLEQAKDGWNSVTATEATT